MRKPRRWVEGVPYHVTVGGDGGAPIFADDADRERFETLLERYVDECSPTLLAYALMGNHAHFCLRPGTTSLPGLMQRLLTAHAHWFNRRHALKGHVYQGRYHCSPCESERQLLATIRYIHLNPVKHGFTTGPDYRWSTHAEYAGAARRDWVDAGTGLAHFGGRARYLDFVRDGLADGFDLTAPTAAPEPPARDGPPALRTDLAELLTLTSERCGVPLPALCRRGRRPPAEVTRARKVFALLATRHGYSRNEVAAALGIGGPSACRLLKRAWDEAAALRSLHASGAE
jgi:REP element-mobilizing transposase RayT